MTGDEGREVCQARLPQVEMDRLCQELGVVQRQRTRHVGMLVRAMVISAGTPGGAYQADARRSYLECEVPHVARSAVYRGFEAPLERCMAALAERALAYARAQPVDLSGPRCGVTDWYMVDATTVTVRDARREELPGTGGYAAIGYAAMKVHKVLSVGCGAPVPYHCRPAREPDSRPLQIDESWRGDGLLADLASASVDRLRACEAPDVRFVIRLQEHGKPQVDDGARGQVTQAFCPGTDVDARLADDTLVLDGRTMDADVHLGQGRRALPLRLVGVQTPTGYGFFLTHLPARIGPRQVADLYRVRWEVERSLRLDKSVNRLDAIDTERSCTLKTRLYASLMASTIAALLAHTHHGHTRPQQAGAPRAETPRQPRRLALPLAVSCQSIAQAFDLNGTEAQPRWNTMAEWLTHSGKDPHWRRRPSVRDQRRGWTRQSLTRKPANHGELRHGPVQAAA